VLIRWSGYGLAVAKLNVLVMVADRCTPREHEVRTRLLDTFTTRGDLEAMVVGLPRAEAMLTPRLIGLWGHLVVIGTAASPRLPAQVVLDHESELFDVLPPVTVIGSANDLWPDWMGLRNALRHERIFVPEDDDVVERVVAAIQSTHGDDRNRLI
jgi:hypothetical protein